MKKLASILLSAILTLTLALSLVGCSTPYEGQIAIFMPDGAPALAFAKLMNDENQLGKENLTYNVVDANNIKNYIANGSATAALMPVNLAVKLCGNGEKYKLLSVNTHGNLYVLSKQTPDGINSLKGKKVGVVNLANVPGLTFKAILNKNNIAFTEDESAHTGDNIFLKTVQPTAIGQLLNATDDTKLDYIVAPEPQVSKITSSAPVIKSVFSLQQLWGEQSYPQAVLVVKNELAKDTEFCNKLLSALDEGASWVKTNGAKAHATISEHCVEGYATTLVAGVLTENAITGCNIKVVKANAMKETIKDYMAKINAVSATSFGTPSDAFFI